MAFFRILRLSRLLNTPSPAPEKRLFSAGRALIYQACRSFDPLPEKSPRSLMREYMGHVLRINDPLWWQAHLSALFQPWFIWQYCREHGLLPASCAPPPALPFHFIRPEKNDFVFLSLRLLPCPAAPPEGQILIGGDGGEELAAFLSSRGFALRDDYWRIRVDRYTGPLFHRGAETGCRLLEAGWGIYTEDEALGRAILHQEYLPEQNCWVLPDPDIDWLMVRCPADAPAFPYLLMAGGKQTENGVRFPLRYVARLQDILAHTPFHVDDQARERMDAWQEAAYHASVYQPRRHKQHPPVPSASDIFHTMLHQAPRVPADLIDDEL